MNICHGYEEAFYNNEGHLAAYGQRQYVPQERLQTPCVLGARGWHSPYSNQLQACSNKPLGLNVEWESELTLRL